jgi:HEAT repeat protein
VVEPDGFRIGEVQIGLGNSQVIALAKGLHALQVGQIVVVPGLSNTEAAAFIQIANADHGSVRTAGGVRALLGSAGVSHMAVVEVSLRAGEEDGLVGMDLMNTSLDSVAEELSNAARRWAENPEPGDDEMARAIGQFETATRDIAVERVATALMHLDERARLKVLAHALKTNSSGQRMDGMLDVISHLKPAALARLLTLVANQAGTDPQRIAAAMPLPEETAKLLDPLLNCPSGGDVPGTDEPSAQAIAEEMAQEEDPGEIQRQVVVAAPQLSASRALATAVAVSRTHPNEESVRTIAEVLPQTARDGALPTVREALRRLDELSGIPELMVETGQALATLSEPDVLGDVCATIETDADAAIVGEILHAAGPTGAETLLETYLRGSDEQRSLLRPAMRQMSEAVLGVARSRLRVEEPSRAIAVLLTLPVFGDRRAVAIMAEALSHLDEHVRFAAITALADTPGTDAANALMKALGHPEPETQRFAVREIGRVKAAPAVHQLTRALEDLNVLQRTYETKKEVIRALERIGK